MKSSPDKHADKQNVCLFFNDNSFCTKYKKKKEKSILPYKQLLLFQICFLK